MSDFNAPEYFKCFADRTRLDIIKLLREGESYVELIASRLSLTPATVCFHLKKLESAGLVNTRREQFYIMYSLNDDMLNQSIAQIIESESSNDLTETDGDYEQSVITSFIKYGKLTALPVQRKKREIILREIVKRFDFDRDYTEKEVNTVITLLHDDYCTVRRELIGFGFMERNHEIYRRIK